MNIFLAGTSLAPAYGGPAYSVSRLATGLAERGHRVGLWTPDSVMRDEEALLKKLAETQKPPQSREKGFWTRMKEALGA